MTFHICSNRRRHAWVPPGRSLHLDDVENLVGGPRAGPVAVGDARSAYERIVAPAPGDHVVSACNPGVVVEFAARWFPSRWLVRRGKDGADRALLEAVDPADAARRYDRVVVGSGDGAFADLASELRRHGVDVWVVAPRGGLNRQLAAAAHVICLLPLPHAGRPEAA